MGIKGHIKSAGEELTPVTVLWMCSTLFDWDVDNDGNTDELGSEKMLKSSPLSSAVWVSQ